MALIEYLVKKDIITDARANWHDSIDPSGCKWWWWSRDRHELFLKYVGITQAQWDEYEESWSLRVSKVAKKKLEVLAGPAAAHHVTLFKVIEARYG